MYVTQQWASSHENFLEQRKFQCASLDLYSQYKSRHERE